MSENIFDEVSNEGESQEVVEQPEKTGAETITEKKQEVVEKKDIANPDDKQPTDKERWRWMQMRKTNRELKERLETIAKETEALKASKQEPKTETLPQWWINSYGDTKESQDAFRTYQENTKAEKDRIKAEVLEEIRNEKQSEVKGSEEAQKFIDQEIEDMKDEGLTFETNELMKFIVDFQTKYGAGSLLDANDNYDLRKALDLMHQLQPKVEDKNIEIKKKVAGNLIKTKVNAKESTIPTVTRRSLRNGSWRDAQ